MSKPTRNPYLYMKDDVLLLKAYNFELAVKHEDTAVALDDKAIFDYLAIRTGVVSLRIHRNLTVSVVYGGPYYYRSILSSHFYLKRFTFAASPFVLDVAVPGFYLPTTGAMS